MTRPNPDPDDLDSGLEAWDASLRDKLAAVFTNPYPVPQFADSASLPSATSYDRCLAATIDDNKLWFSNGTVWREVSFV